MVTLILEPKMKCMLALMIEEREKLGFSQKYSLGTLIIGEYQWQTQPYSVTFGIRTQATLASALATEAQKRGGDGRGEGKGEGEGESTLTVKFLAKAKKPTPAVRVASAFLERRSLTIPSEPENAA